MQEKSPIFIHSLFRTGSTYLFSVFRRSTEKYWCYQEPLHEMAVFARDEPQLLFVDHGEEKSRLLRHPQIIKMYFQELYDTWPTWKDALNTSAVYNGYFASPDSDIGIPFWRSLIDAARGRPVFQECRTPGRIEAIKGQLNGYHIYLWRNPWDQWWSYKVAPYFDVANHFIINAPNSPPAVQLLRTSLGLEACVEDDLGGAFACYAAKPFSSEESYLVFYMLWCLGLQAGDRHAHLMLNIDRLSDSSVYRDEMQAQLVSAGIEGIDFSDCHIPHGRYLEQEMPFFIALEDKVHQWLKEGGWSQDELNHIQKLRELFQPIGWSKSIEDFSPRCMAEQASRARDLARRFETNAAENVRKWVVKATVAETNNIQAEAKAEQSEVKAQQAEAKAQQAEAKAKLAEDKAKLAEAGLNAIYVSHSWRLTAPLRWLTQKLRKFKS